MPLLNPCKLMLPQAAVARDVVADRAVAAREVIAANAATAVEDARNFRPAEAAEGLAAGRRVKVPLFGFVSREQVRVSRSDCGGVADRCCRAVLFCALHRQVRAWFKVFIGTAVISGRWYCWPPCICFSTLFEPWTPTSSAMLHCHQVYGAAGVLSVAWLMALGAGVSSVLLLPLAALMFVVASAAAFVALLRKVSNRF